jgi:hypothetical protein
MEGTKFNTVTTASASVPIIDDEAQARMTLECACRANINTGCISAMHTLLFPEKPPQRAIFTPLLEFNFGPGIR